MILGCISEAQVKIVWPWIKPRSWTPEFFRSIQTSRTFWTKIQDDWLLLLINSAYLIGKLGGQGILSLLSSHHDKITFIQLSQLFVFFVRGIRALTFKMCVRGFIFNLKNPNNNEQRNKKNNQPKKSETTTVGRLGQVRLLLNDYSKRYIAIHLNMFPIWLLTVLPGIFTFKL